MTDPCVFFHWSSLTLPPKKASILLPPTSTLISITFCPPWGAVRIDIYFPTADLQLQELTAKLPEIFQVAVPKAQRSGYGKCLNVNERTLAALTENGECFSFRCLDISQEPAVAPAPKKEQAQQVFSRLPALTRDRLVLGIDIGGTDIKLAVSVNGGTSYCKEY